MPKYGPGFNASQVQQGCKFSTKGMGGNALTQCYIREVASAMALGAKFPANSLVYKVWKAAQPAVGRASGAMLNNLSPSPAQLTPSLLGVNRSDQSMGVPSLERAEPQTSMSFPINTLVTGATAVLGSLVPSSSAPPVAGQQSAAPISTGAALLNIGQSLVNQWLNPMTGMMGMAAPMTGAMMGRAALTGAMEAAGGMMMGRAMNALSGLFAPGQRRPNSRRVKSLVRLVGVETAAMTLGLSVPQTAWIAVRPGRRRGISSRDVRTARRVVRFACNLSSSLATVRAAPRRRKC